MNELIVDMFRAADPGTAPLASPAPLLTSGDLRSEGSGPGLVGNPVLILGGVVLLGLSGASNDMRDILSLAGSGDARARLAVDVFCYRLKKYIGAYTAVLGRVDALVFTGGIGENNPVMRLRILEGMGRIGVRVDPERNAVVVGAEGDGVAERLGRGEEHERMPRIVGDPRPEQVVAAGPPDCRWCGSPIDPDGHLHVVHHTAHYPRQTLYLSNASGNWLEVDSFSAAYSRIVVDDDGGAGANAG